MSLLPAQYKICDILHAFDIIIKLSNSENFQTFSEEDSKIAIESFSFDCV